MRHMDIQLIQIENDEFESLFSVVKQGLYSHVDAVFGWCDEFQVNRLKNDYEPHWFHWVYLNNTQVGMLCFKPYENAFHVHLLIVFPEFQNQQLGGRVMNVVHEMAREQGRSHVTLSSFTRNESAVRFYKSLGYKVTESDENFLSLSLQVAS
ncbi:GNAT family N-acetyltransferase [Vibrio parahaemolyticus]|uniref:GNAT family N-acetyltransferase n=1 Tax=Vibrio TaxID=662 RepID=UPI0011222A6B|nr:GNAT family N-acetyltransferase [Vibrio parahaemolyticus]EIO4097971.1 GNAT family N-acetyltransferase [Vibrio parahaemolyticus]EIY9802925.1 GNAT family N-acetyltransferase [Vibrio parahaemolyticus]EJC7123397.1 GNAT family N-acetyltransferase [Vibrio parahaemolyticus]EJE4731061.1 GNAT family N-acetyltransferase [Vibrio parahaemolyticus]MBE4169213.1 GNAT family N-acetyltransferase [Vibrio parahaemolyticus]